MPPPIVADTDLPAGTDWRDSDDGSDGGGGGCAAGPRPPRGGASGSEGASKGCTRCNTVATKRRHPRSPSHRLLRSPFGSIESSSRSSCQFATTFRIPFPFPTWCFCCSFLFFSSFDLVSFRTVSFLSSLCIYKYCSFVELGKVEVNLVPRNWGTDSVSVHSSKHHLFLSHSAHGR